MSATDPIITAVDFVELPVHYPRTVGRNARLGSHGAGGSCRAVILSTLSGATGWGVFEGDPTGSESMVSSELSALIDPDTGVRDERLSWADIALHDLLGNVTDRPVWDLLGAGGEREVAVYDGAIYFDDLDPDDQPRGISAVLDNCAADAQLGFTGFKVKIGRGNRWMDRAAGDARDIEVTRAVRQAWPDARILVDANDGYDVAGICRYLDAVADVGLYWVEEPFLDDAAALAEFRAYLDRVSPATLIADGERDPAVPELVEIARAGHLDVLLMDVLSYGISRWRRLKPQLDGLPVSVSPHAWGRPLKTLYAAQLAAGLGGVPIVEGVPGYTEGVDTDGYRFTDGRLTVSDRPGFGLPVPSL